MEMFGIVILAHFIADFVCQTRKMGDNKSKSMKWLSLHIATYTAILGLLTFWIFPNILAFTVWIVVNSLLHFLTDFVTSRGSGYFYIKQKWYWFWMVIGGDQTIHTMTLYYTFLAYGT